MPDKCHCVAMLKENNFYCHQIFRQDSFELANYALRPYRKCHKFIHASSDSNDPAQFNSGTQKVLKV